MQQKLWLWLNGRRWSQSRGESSESVRAPAVVSEGIKNSEGIPKGMSDAEVHSRKTASLWEEENECSGLCCSL